MLNFVSEICLVPIYTHILFLWQWARKSMSADKGIIFWGVFSLFWSFWCSPFSTNFRHDCHKMLFCPNETQAIVLWNLFTSSISVGRNSFSVRPKCDASKIITLKKEILMHLRRVSSQDNQFWWIKPWLNLYSWQNQNWSCLDSHQQHWPIKII